MRAVNPTPRRPDCPEAADAPFWRRWLLIHLLLAGVLLAWIAGRLQPVGLPEAAGEGIRCLSYSPFYRPGTSPLDSASQVSPEQIAADLGALRRLTGCVRIYAVSQGLEAVPEAARMLGMEVLLGAWLGADEAANRRQLDAAVALANAYPGTVRALLVGNEVLLRGDLPPSRLGDWLREARRRVRVPVSYADVWEFWLQHRELLAAVDFATVHILPFWEDHPVGIEEAVAHVATVRTEVEAAFGQPVLVGETGWPAAGRQRQDAVPGRVNQARFVRELLVRANREGWDYNLIEAIDQPWKRTLEGTVGGHWGILDADLTPKFSLRAAVAERESWGRLPWLGGGGALLAALLAGFSAGARRWRLAAFAASGLWAGLVAALAIEHAELAWRDSREWWVLGTVGVLGPLWLALAALAIGSGRAAHGLHRLLIAARLLLLYCAALAALWLAVDPRYRDFPLWLYAGVAPALLLLRSRLAGGREEAICALAIVLAGATRWSTEMANPQAIAWFALCAVLALAGWTAREQQQGEQRAG